MHSSRMRTGHPLTACRSLLRGVYLVPGGLTGGGLSDLGVSAPRGSAPGGICSGGSVPGGCLLWGGLLPGVCSGGCLLLVGVGVSAPGGSASDMPPPPVNRIIDTSKNIMLATTSLRLVIMTEVAGEHGCENSMQNKNAFQ